MTVQAERESTEYWTPPIVIDPIPGESLGGLLIRHCEVNGWPSLENFARQIGTTTNRARWGSDAHRLSKAIAMDASSLAHAERKRGSLSAEVCGHRLALRHLDIGRRRVCSACLVEHRYQREWWELAFLDTCPTHGIALVDRCACGAHLSWLDTRLDGCSDCRSVWADEMPMVTATPFERWCFWRLGIAEKPATEADLDALPLARSIELFENVGLLAISGYRQFRPRQDEVAESAAEIRERGFQAIRDGAMVKLARSALPHYRVASGKFIPKAPHEILGWFGLWIAGLDLADGDPVCMLLKQALTEVLGFPVTDLHASRVTALDLLATHLRMTETSLLELAHAQGVVVYGAGRGRCVSSGYAAKLTLESFAATNPIASTQPPRKVGTT
jgi:hypothetical protein